jgi:hypothetical protein
LASRLTHTAKPAGKCRRFNSYKKSFGDGHNVVAMMRIQTTLATVLAILAFGAAVAAQTAEKAPETLAGLWGVEATFGFQAQGDLTIDARGGAWKARLAGYQVDVKLDKNRVQFSLPGDGGEFRGQLDRTSNAIRGEWIQPPGKILQNPYATPVELRPVAASVWQGRVVPLEQQISVYADIRSDTTGKMTAVLANPEMNFFRKRVFAITQDGDKVHLEAKGWKIEGTYDAKSDQLSLQLVDFLPPFQFSRRTQKDAVGFYPRTPAGGEYRYQPPIAHDDGWATGTLAQEHLDEAAIRKLIDQILGADPNDSSWNIQSLLIARHGRLVLEEYFRGFDGERPHDMRSASKTFAPVLVGVAREHGVKLSPTTPVYPEFRQYQHFENWDARKEAVTLRDIMTMTAETHATTMTTTLRGMKTACSRIPRTTTGTNTPSTCPCCGLREARMRCIAPAI